MKIMKMKIMKMKIGIGGLAKHKFEGPRASYRGWEYASELPASPGYSQRGSPYGGNLPHKENIPLTQPIVGQDGVKTNFQLWDALPYNIFIGAHPLR